MSEKISGSHAAPKKKTKWQQRIDNMNAKPTIVIAEISYTVNGGDVRNAELSLIRGAVTEALSRSAVDQGMEWALEQKIRSILPDDMEKLLTRKGLQNTQVGAEGH